MGRVEHQILLATCHWASAADRSEKLRTLMEGAIDADGLIELALKEGLAGLLYKGLFKAHALDRLGGQPRQRLQTIYYQTLRLNLNLLRDLQEILDHLNQKNIPVVLLQGIALLQQVYDDVGLRPMKDMDLWVLPADHERLVDALVDLGFARQEFYPDTLKRGASVIDVRTHILWADRIRARRLLLNRDQEDIFRRARPVTVEGLQALHLNPYDQFLYLGLHILKHNAERLIWLVDIKNLVSGWCRADWKTLARRAVELGQERTVAYIVFLLADLLGFRPPLEARPHLRIHRLNRLEKAVLKKRRQNGALPTWGQLWLLTAGKGWRRRWALVSETLFPRPAILRQVFADRPDLKNWQLYCKRGRQLLGLGKT